ncbi:MAG: 2-nitropropane dioxygenase [Alphaproteobacteria bacterium]|jgi:nitronate monooxygenase|nr:2-nitropropane dioxygenase [Alphaproteobacteria bacterium]
MWPDRRLTDLFDIDLPIIQAPMAGAQGSAMAIAVSQAGGLGSQPCAMLSLDQARAEIGIIRQQTDRPFNLNFFCHQPTAPSADAEQAWRKALGAYYREFGIDPDSIPQAPGRNPFDTAYCEMIEEFRPKVVSFHFGLPEAALVKRVKAAGSIVISSATSAREARWLEDHGADAVIAQGYEAGGHRGHFLRDNLASHAGTMALVPQVVDAVKVPVIAAGGIADARGVVAAMALGAAAVQIGTAYLFSPEAKITALHRQALDAVVDDSTALTNIFTGRPARGIVNRAISEIGPIAKAAPPFPTATSGIAPLRAKAEAAGSGEFSPLWSGQAANLAKPMSAGEFTTTIMAEAAALLRRLSG